jgi:hypothetical protein
VSGCALAAALLLLLIATQTCLQDSTKTGFLPSAAKAELVLQAAQTDHPQCPIKFKATMTKAKAQKFTEVSLD